MDAGRYAVLSLWISEKRLIGPTATGIIPISVQPKSEPGAVFAATTTTQTPKAMIPTEIKNENAAFMLASVPKKSVQPKTGHIASRKIEADGMVGAPEARAKDSGLTWGKVGTAGGYENPTAPCRAIKIVMVMQTTTNSARQRLMFSS
jgi:hypothetical protein